LRIISTLLLALAPILAAYGDDASGARTARHTILPFVGYQTLHGEHSELNYDISVVDPSLPDTVFPFSGSFGAKHNSEPPALGLAYRYQPIDRLQFELALTVFQNGSDYKYPLVLDFYGFRRRSDITVHRTNLTNLGADAMYAFNTQVKWLTGGVRLGIGYAWRDITYSWQLKNTPGVVHTFRISDSDRILTIKGGFDFWLWSGNNLLVQGGLNYTQFLPQRGDSHPFGGIGWRMGVFPIWSGSPEE